jgi:predicted nucleic acid-binding protein
MTEDEIEAQAAFLQGKSTVMATRIYFDACCLNRPFDDQSQARIRLETEATEHLLRAVEEGKLLWVASDALLYEIHKCPEEDRRTAVLALCARATERVAIDEVAMRRAIDLRLHGLRDLDALHLACAERGGVEVLVTTDDAFISTARRLTPASSTRVVNPVVYALEVLQ